MGKASIEKKSAKKSASYFRVPFLIFVPSQLSESLEQAIASENQVAVGNGSVVFFRPVAGGKLCRAVLPTSSTHTYTLRLH